MKTHVSELYEIKLYLGDCRSRPILPNGLKSTDKITKVALIKAIGEFQEEYRTKTVPVRITNTTFVSETNYSEDGWEVAAISYPHTNHSHRETLDFMLNLAEHLLNLFLQNRICVLDKQANSMLESEDV